MTTKERKIGARSVIVDTGAWDSLGTGDFNQKRGAFGEFVDERILTDRSTAHQLIEIGIIERAVSKRHEW